MLPRWMKPVGLGAKRVRTWVMCGVLDSSNAHAGTDCQAAIHRGTAWGKVLLRRVLRNVLLNTASARYEMELYPPGAFGLRRPVIMFYHVRRYATAYPNGRVRR